MANKQTPYLAENIKKHTNIPPSGGWFVAFLAIPLLVFALSFQTAPVRAQGVFVTPTPLPAIVATANAAEQAQSAAQASRNEADRLNAQANEIRRNADAQSARAAQDLSDARAASAAQNAGAIGEAIGSASSQLEQLQTSVSGQAAIIATLTADKQAAASEIYSLTIALQQERASKRVIQDSYTALSTRFEAANLEAQKQGQSAPVVTFVFATGFFAMLIVVIIVVLQRRESKPVDADTAQDEIIDGEVTP